MAVLQKIAPRLRFHYGLPSLHNGLKKGHVGLDVCLLESSYFYEIPHLRCLHTTLASSRIFASIYDNVRDKHPYRVKNDWHQIVKNNSLISSNFHTTAGACTSVNDSGSESKIDSLLETWFYEVSPYGTLTANLPFSTTIKPLNPQDYPDMNKVIIQLHFNSPNTNDIPRADQLAQISGLYDLHADFDDDKANMSLNCDVIQGLTLPISCTLYVPLKFGLTLKVNEDNDISVENMESDSIVIETEAGDCCLKSIKSGSVSVISKSGDIFSSSTVLGNCILYTGNTGRIKMKKIQGSGVTCKTEMGSLFVKSLYSEAATFNTVNGEIHLGDCHGQVHILAENSHVDIGSLDGDLDVALQNGSVNVLLSRHNRVDIDIHTGNINLSFPEGASTDLNLNCPSVTVDENIDVNFEDTDIPHHKEGFIGKPGVSKVNARTLSGTISLRLLDWIATTRLAFKKDD